MMIFLTVSLQTFYGLPTLRAVVIAVEFSVRPFILILPSMLLAIAAFLLMQPRLSDPVSDTTSPDAAIRAARRKAVEADARLHYLEGEAHHVLPRGGLSN